ncbi:MAG TPA: ester cyclase [Steroidobacteraceae bacterium]|nr:ester cyclase [Steroidobacteraceae bacterium]
MQRQVGRGWRVSPLLVLALAFQALTPDATAAAQTAVAFNEQLARRYFEEVWNRGKLDVLDELLAPNYINHTPSSPDPAPGPDGLKPIVLAMRRAFPDLRYEIKDVVATEESVVIRVVMTGTHRGDLFGLAPTNRRVTVNQINIERIENGRIAEHWRVTDELTLMRQLGFAP